MNRKPIASQNSLRTNGFTLVELLVVIIIIAVLTSIGFPLANRVKASANKTQCMGRLRSWGVAFGSYAADNNGKVVWRNWAPIGWDTGSPYVPYWTGGTVDLPSREDSGGHSVQLQMRHCPAVKDTGGGNSSVNYAMIRPSGPSGLIPNQNDYALSSIMKPNRFLMMIEAIPNSGAAITSSAELTTTTKPLTLKGPNLRHDHTVNAILGDFSVKAMAWKELETGVTQDYWTKLAP